MFNQKLFQTVRQSSLIRQPQRFFSNSIKPNVSSSPMAYLLLGGSLAGFGYLTYQTMAMNANKQAYMAQGQTYMSKLVQQRLGQTLGYTAYGLLSTGGFVYYLRNSTIGYSMNPWLMFGGTLAFMFGAHLCDYQTMYPLKLAMYTGMTGMIGVSLLPLIQASSMALVADAALATGVSMTSLAAIAYNAPSEQFLNWGGPLALGCGGMFAVSMMSMFYPQSRALYNIWLWGGLGLTGALTLYKTQAIIYRAKTEQYFDPLGNSIGIYMDAVNFFVRFMMILGNRKNK